MQQLRASLSALQLKLHGITLASAAKALRGLTVPAEQPLQIAWNKPLPSFAHKPKPYTGPSAGKLLVHCIAVHTMLRALFVRQLHIW
jgi:hypothetical protein